MLATDHREASRGVKIASAVKGGNGLFSKDEGDGVTFLEKTIKYANRFQENKNSSQVS